MTRETILREWKRDILNTHIALNRFYATLIEWQANDHTIHPDDFNHQLDLLKQDRLLYDWADKNPAGGGLDNLFEAVTGQAPGDDHAPIETTDAECVQRLFQGAPRQ